MTMIKRFRSWLTDQVEIWLLKTDWSAKWFLRLKRANRSRVDRFTKRRYRKARIEAVEAINLRLKYGLPMPVPDAEEFVFDDDGDRYQRQRVSRYGRGRV